MSRTTHVAACNLVVLCFTAGCGPSVPQPDWMLDAGVDARACEREPKLTAYCPGDLLEVCRLEAWRGAHQGGCSADADCVVVKTERANCLTYGLCWPYAVVRADKQAAFLAGVEQELTAPGGFCTRATCSIAGQCAQGTTTPKCEAGRCKGVHTSP